MKAIQHVTSRCNALAFTLLIGAALVLAGCDSGMGVSDEGASPGETAQTAKGGPPGKVDICHYDADADTYFLINVGAPAAPAHRAHGDALPGEDVPTMEGFVFDDACTPRRVASIACTTERIVNGDGTWTVSVTGVLPEEDRPVEGGSPQFGQGADGELELILGSVTRAPVFEDGIIAGETVNADFFEGADDTIELIVFSDFVNEPLGRSCGPYVASEIPETGTGG